jgi:hypothetical protein
MITCSSIGYNGRLANQIFQFASTIGIARKLGYDPKFPIENFISGDPHDYNGGKLRECFDIPDHYFEFRDKITRSISYVYNEGSFKYDEATREVPDGVDLRGYFQSELYFKDCSDEIRKLLKFRDEYNQKASIYIDSIKLENPNKELTSVHVRRGDYLQYPDHHPACPLEYYKKAMSHLSGKCDQIFILFSDDPEWCRENFRGPDFLISNLGDAYSEMCAMTMCHNNIIANSSFSWWGAWLNCGNNIVIAPNKWFGPMLDKDTSDVYCKDWIKF